MDFYINPFKAHVQCNIFQINKIKWGPDECSASGFEKFLLARLLLWIAIVQCLTVNAGLNSCDMEMMEATFQFC